MDTVLLTFGDTEISVLTACLAGGGVLLLIIIFAIWSLLASNRARAEEAEDAADEANERAIAMERSLAGMMQLQGEMTGRMQTMAEIFGTRTSDLARLVNERLDHQGQRVSAAMQETRTKTEEGLSKLHERLAVIDRAQTTMTGLSSDILGLQSILANKQTRGAFGQGRMETIIGDGLASNNYRFQATLSNGSRPDCLVLMPNDAPALVIDAKFPLESWQAIANATSPDEARLSGNQFKIDIGIHVKAIAEKYLIAGETQDTAFMFVPSESIFADLHEKFEDVVQKAGRQRVIIVSPSLLMLSIQVIQALLRDVSMREQAHLIQKEVRELLTDVGRLDDRVRKLQTHFTQTSNDIGEILTSTGKVIRRSERIDQMDFEDRDKIAAQ